MEHYKNIDWTWVDGEVRRILSDVAEQTDYNTTLSELIFLECLHRLDISKKIRVAVKKTESFGKELSE